jgi:hypothetical protein
MSVVILAVNFKDRNHIMKAENSRCSYTFSSQMPDSIVLSIHTIEISDADFLFIHHVVYSLKQLALVPFASLLRA